MEFNLKGKDTLKILAVLLSCIAQITSLTAQDFIKADSIIRYNFIGEDSVRSIKSIFAYDQLGNQVEKIDQRWLENSLQWENFSRITQHFTNGLVDTLTNWSFDEMDWVGSTRIITTHSSAGEIIETLSETYDPEKMVWQSNTNVFWPNSQQAFPHRVSLIWDTLTNIWVPTDSLIIKNNADGNVSTDTTFSWDDSLHIFEYAGAAQYIYDDAQNLVGNILFQYNKDSAEFIPLTRVTNKFNSNQFLTMTEVDIWNQDSSIWMKQAIFERKSNSDGLLEESTFWLYNMDSAAYLIFDRTTHTYTDGKARAKGDTLLLYRKNFMYQNGLELPRWVEHYFYPSEDVTAVSEGNNENLFRVYPNPARDHVRIEGDVKKIRTYTWISIDGQKISHDINRTNVIKVPEPQASGSVFLLLKDARGHLLQSSKIILLK